MQLLYYYTFIRSLSFAFSTITMSALEPHSQATYLGSSSSTPLFAAWQLLGESSGEQLIHMHSIGTLVAESHFKKLENGFYGSSSK